MPDADPERASHPLGIELLVNCAECGSILQAESCNNDDGPFSKQILITVAKCECVSGEGATGCADDTEYVLSDALRQLGHERLNKLLNETLNRG
jgi:hypothetical protein